MVMSMEICQTLGEMNLARFDLPEKKKLKKLGSNSIIKMMLKNTMTSKLPKEK